MNELLNEKTLIIDLEIEKLKEGINQSKNKIIDLKIEKIKMQNPKLTEFVEKNFINSSVTFETKSFGLKVFTLEKYYGVKNYSIPINIEYIDKENIIIKGLKKNIDSDNKELYEELYKLTENIFPLNATLSIEYDREDIEYKYGIVETNALGIKYVNLDRNYVSVYHKSEKYLNYCLL